MTTTTTTASTSSPCVFDTYNLVGLDFVWTAVDGVTSYTVYRQAGEADAWTTAVAGFDYNSDECDQSVRELIMNVIDNGTWEVSNITEIGGTITRDCDPGYQFEGEVTSVSQAYTTVAN